MSKAHIIPDAALTEHLGIFGTTGSGKSYTARGLVERVMRPKTKPRMVILDPKGDWWGARLDADGKGSGLPFTIIGGPHADEGLRIAPENPGPLAKPLAHMIASSDVRCIIDLSDLEAGSMRMFVATLLKILYHENRQELYLVMDEADEFAPMSIRAGSKEAAFSLGATERIAKRGRGRGLIFWPITQRPASVHTDVRGMMKSLAIQMLTLPHDRKAIREWFDGQMPGDDAQAKAALDAVVSSLPKLAVGEGWAWCPKIGDGAPKRGKFPPIETYDSMKAPARGDTTGNKPLPPIDTTSVTTALAQAATDAFENDPAKLKARIATLEREAKAKPAAKASTGIDPATVNKAIDGAVATTRREMKASLALQIRAIAKTTAHLKKWTESLTSDLGSLDAGIGALATMLEAPMATPALNQSTPIRPLTKPAMVVEPRRIEPRRIPMPTSNGTTRKAAEQRVLDAIAQMEAIGVAEPSTAAIGLLAGIDPTGGYFSNTIGPLSSEGLVIRGAGCVRFTDEGRAAAHPPDQALDMESYHAMLRRVVAKKSGATARMLDALIEAGPGGITAEELGKRVSIDHTGGYFSNTIGPLSTLGLIERRAGVVTTTALLFPEALAWTAAGPNQEQGT